MKKLVLVFAAVAAMLLAASCNKEQNAPVDNSEPQAQESELVTIQVTIPEELSKVALGYTGSALALTWSAGDKIRVADHSNPSTNYQDFTLASGEGTKSATFTGTEISAASYDISIISVVAVPSGVGLLSQTQSVDGNTEHLGYGAVLSGVNTYENITFSSEWASSKGGSLAQSGALHLKATLPDGVAAKVISVTMSADQPIFGGGIGTMVVNLTSQADTGSDNVLDVYATIPASGVTVPSGTSLLFKFGTNDAGHSVYTRYYKTPSALNLAGGQLNLISLTGTNTDKYAGKDDDGTAEHPYLIGDKYQMDAVHDLLVGDQTLRYFKMVDDIDMSGITWVPLNNVADGSSKYSKYIYFDGDDHTLSYVSTSATPAAYPSIFGVLNGTVTNLTVDHATITPGPNESGGKSAILAGYLGSSDCTVTPSVSNVTITNSTVGTSGAKGGNYCGALVAQMSKAGTTVSNITITDCTVATTNYAGGMICEIGADATISGTNTVTNTDVYGTLAGGVVGFANALVTMSGCTYDGGTVNGTARYVGGMLGSTGNYSSVISDCHVNSGTINAASDRVGGFIGQLQVKAQIKGCSVGTPTKRVTINSTKTSATVNVGGFVGVCYGSITKNSDVRNKAYVTITSSNTNTGTYINIGGFAAYHEAASIEYSDADAVMSSIVGTRVGGFVAYMTNKSGGCVVNQCTAKVAVSGNNYVGGFIADAQAATHTVTNNTVSGTVTGAGTVGGFVGQVMQGTWTKNSSSCTVTGTTNVGGFAGQLNGSSVAISKCCSTGDATAGTGATCGGFAGIAKNGVSISDCYATGNASGGGRKRGGLVAYVDEGTVNITRCYATGNINNNFESGGLIGVANAAAITVTKSAAWNSSISASSRTDANWSSAAIVGVSYLTSTLTDNYRNPDMELTAYWGTAGYGVQLTTAFQHPNVSPSAVLTDWDGNTVVSTTMRPYQGKCEPGKTLSQLAATTLGWSSEVWDFTADLPTLK